MVTVVTVDWREDGRGPVAAEYAVIFTRAWEGGDLKRWRSLGGLQFLKREVF
jgi:hypothetical protein